MSLVTTDLLQLARMDSPTGSMVLHLKNPLTGKDHYVLISDLLTGRSYEDWIADQEYEEGERVTFGFKLFESLQDENEGNIPSGGVGDVWWKEVSESAKPDVLERTISKVAHGFESGDVLKVNGAGELALISDPGADKRVALVTEVIDVNSFKAVLGGYATGLSGLTPGTVYYAQADGTIDVTETEMPVLHADTSTSGYILSSAASGGSAVVVTDNYANVAALLAAQGDQEQGKWYGVTDASADPTVDASWAIYEYLGTTDGDLGDYIKRAEFESLDVVINDASPSVKGIAKLYNDLSASNTDGSVTQAGIKSVTDANAAAAAAKWTAVDADETTRGYSELATNAETITGTDTTRTITPSRLTAWWNAIKAAAVAFTNTLSATDITATNQSGSGFVVSMFDSTGKLVRNANATWNDTTKTLRLTGVDNLDATYSFEVYNLAGSLVARFSNGQFVEFGGTSMFIEVGSTIASGAAGIIMNDNQALAFVIKSSTSDNYLGFRTTDSDEAVLFFRVQEFDRGNGFVTRKEQYAIVTTGTSAATNTIIASIPVPSGKAIDLKVTLAFGKTSGGRVISTGIIQVAASNIAGTTSGGVTSAPDTVRKTATTGGFNVNINDTTDTIDVRFLNETGTGYAYDCHVQVEYCIKDY